MHMPAAATTAVLIEQLPTHADAAPFLRLLRTWNVLSASNVAIKSKVRPLRAIFAAIRLAPNTDTGHKDQRYYKSVYKLTATNDVQ